MVSAPKRSAFEASRRELSEDVRIARYWHPLRCSRAIELGKPPEVCVIFSAVNQGFLQTVGACWRVAQPAGPPEGRRRPLPAQGLSEAKICDIHALKNAEKKKKKLKIPLVLDRCTYMFQRAKTYACICYAPIR